MARASPMARALALIEREAVMNNNLIIDR
jgi:hypothetical protein